MSVWADRISRSCPEAVVGVTTLRAEVEGDRSTVEMLTVQDVADELNVSASLLYGLIAAGEIECYRIGRRRGTIRVRREDLDRYLENCRVASGTAPERVPRQQLKHLRL